MKRIILALIAAFISYVFCNAQIKVPVQTDTLIIRSMQYHFEEIRPENYPFKYVIRKAQSFTFGDQEFIIENSFDTGFYKHFELEGTSEDLILDDENDDVIEIKFLGYILICDKPKR